MKLEIISGQQNVEINTIFSNMLKENNICERNTSGNHYLIYPELELHHPKKILHTVRKIVKDHIESDSDLYILTYSDHVLNAVRLEVKAHNFSGSRCHQIVENNIDICAKIDEEGRLDVWATDIFDVWDQELLELL